jgi:hypothetical protein
MKATTAMWVVMLGAMAAHGQLAVTVSPPKVVGQKAVVSLALKNRLADKVESARAVCFLLDERGKMLGQMTRWVIGGSDESRGLPAGATNSFHFVITTDKPILKTNLTAKVTFSRVVLEGGKLADPQRDVQIAQ